MFLKFRYQGIGFAMASSGLFYNRVTIVATIVTQISWIILIIFKLLNVTTNDLAYLGYDHSYDRNTVIVQATDGVALLPNTCTIWSSNKRQRDVKADVQEV